MAPPIGRPSGDLDTLCTGDDPAHARARPFTDSETVTLSVAQAVVAPRALVPDVGRTRLPNRRRRLPIPPHPNPIETRGTLTRYVMPAVPHPPGKAGCGIPAGRPTDPHSRRLRGARAWRQPSDPLPGNGSPSTQRRLQGSGVQARIEQVIDALVGPFSQRLCLLVEGRATAYKLRHVHGPEDARLSSELGEEKR